MSNYYSKRKEKKQSIIAILMVIFLVGVMFFSLISIVKEWEKSQSYDEYVMSSTAVVYNGETYVQNPLIQTVMLLGIDTIDPLEDSGTYNNEYQSDFIALIVIDNDNETYKILQINRDTMTDIPVLGLNGIPVSTMEAQLALAYNYGNGLEDSSENVAEAVSDLLWGIDVDNYITLSMGAIPTLNDAVGGVTVTIEDDFSSVNDTFIMGETITLLGDDALAFVRSRLYVDDSTNISRMARQTQYIQALYEKLGNDDDGASALTASVLTKVADYMVTDTTVNYLSTITEKISDYEFEGFVSIDGEGTVNDVYMEFYIDEDSLNQTVIDLFFTKVN